jgi:hypothetical protein
MEIPKMSMEKEAPLGWIWCIREPAPRMWTIHVAHMTRTGRLGALEAPGEAMMLVDTVACATQAARAPGSRA